MGQGGGGLWVFGIILGLPLILGISILKRKNKDTFVWFAGLLTLKPVVATPIWYAIITHNSMNKATTGIEAMLPGVLITIVLGIICNGAFKPPTYKAARRLLLLDFIRWFSSGLWGLHASISLTPVTSIFCAAILLSIVMPTIFAIVTIVMVGDYELEVETGKGRKS